MSMERMIDPLQAIDNRVTRLEEAISEGLSRIENLLRQQIQDLKTEQIKDIKDQWLRIADDQRRVWDAIRELEKRANRVDGGHHVVNMIWSLLSAAFGGSLVALISWLRH